jgi:alpha-L-rhamnosidase
MSNHANSLLPIQPERLRCEHLANPLGIDVTQPRLSWLIAAGGQGAEVRCQKQAAYRILVASSPGLLASETGDLWDSGEVRSDQSTFIEYGGLPLQSRMRCYWKVMAWLRSSGASDVASSAWSEVACWSMGLLVPDDWSAQWIASPTAAQVEPAPLLRKAFVLGKPITRATAYLSGLGYYELSINGEKVGDRLLDPKVTRYDRRVLYATYDVTAQVREGENALGVMLGNGWYNYHVKNPWHFDEAPWRDTPRLLCQLELEYADGSTRVIVSDGSWQHATGAVQFDGMLNGEVYDARLEKDGWDTAGFDDSGWAAAKVVDAPKGRLVAQMIEPIRIIEVIKPVKLTQPKPGVYLYDLGQNMAGAVRLTVMGPAGTEVKIQYAELLHPDGTLDPTNIDIFCESGEFQTEHYILKGKGLETWQARFMYYGFQYVQVSGFPGEPTLEGLAGLVMHTDVAVVGGFACSNALLNKINHCNLWSYLNNFHGYPTDCPHREKIGWTGDAHIAGETGLYNFDPMAVFTEWLRDFADEQQPDGGLPGIIPTGGWGYERWGGPAWCSALILIPWYMYQYRGDARILAEHYESMKRYVDYLTVSSPGGINDQGMGDWFPAKTETPVDITSTSYYHTDALILSQIAEKLGRRDDAERYASLAADIRRAFNQKFFDRDTGQYGGGAQTANSCGIYQGMVEAADVERVARNLAEDIARNDTHLDCGILGAKYVLHALADNGYVELAYQVAAQTTWPSWGDMVRQGATTLWEGWNADVGTHNHVMLGDISAWFFETLAGIKGDAQGPGFKRIIIRPRLVADLTWVAAHHDSLYGRIVSNWQREGSRLTMDVTIPINTTATVHVPAEDAAGVSESGKPAAQSAGVKFLRMANGAAVYEVGSGVYQFTSKQSL